MSALDSVRRVSGEAAKTYTHRYTSGFFDHYLSGSAILDIGFSGGDPNAVPITETAIGIDLDYPGYDGVVLPFPDETQDAVFSSHCLEHIADPIRAVREWFRVTKIGGFIILIVPHQFLYEKKITPPSKWSRDHKRFYTPGSLLFEIEAALEPNTYRVRHCCDNDLWFDYTIGPDRHPFGCYEIELVIQKIAPPAWKVE